MGRPKRDVRAVAEATTTPPDQLAPSQSLARVVKAEGSNHYACALPDQRSVLVELPARFRNTIWVRRGGYVLVELIPSDARNGKVEGEIVNVVRDEKAWRKQSYWPAAFPLSPYEDSEDEDSTVGKMPPSYSDDEN
ncbi:nucleic acid-binding protein [Durotheca rogersii]|uniref:nucleic acid-binding protein n=1 Tax=Durotheca rogersii TaxID=419775 RepID=UPI00221F33C9|nr:nucleic acid-binding protein [Durotheca rogersii]KAI5868290.1 nucleic acid-binding protein [Durotheca rogersii]